MKKAERRRTDAFELWCWRRLLRVPWTARRSIQSILKECPQVLNIHWQDWCWNWNSSTLATWCAELTHWKRPWCWERLVAGGEGDDRGWDGWMASPTRWTQVWVDSGSWWWTGRPGVLGLQRVGHDWATELNWRKADILVIRCLSCHAVQIRIISWASWWLSGKESTCQCRRRDFDPWVRKISWRRKWQPTPVFLLGKSHGQRKLQSIRSQKSQTWLYNWTTKILNTENTAGDLQLKSSLRRSVVNGEVVREDIMGRGIFAKLNKILAEDRPEWCDNCGGGGGGGIWSDIKVREGFPGSLVVKILSLQFNPWSEN